jgi:RNA polymerase sigma-70 factor (ECF subfamily)
LEKLLYLDEANQYTNEDNLMAKELSIVIDGEIRELPRKMQEVFILSRRQHLSVNEISETLNITPRTVKNQLSNALKILRTKLGMF